MQPFIRYKTAPLPAAARGNPAAQAQAAFAQAVALLQKGQLAQAKALLENIVAVQPQHYHALHLLGVIAAQSGDFQASVDSIGKAIALFPGDANFHINQGNSLRALRQADAAVASYDRAIALRADNAMAHANRGVALLELGQWEAAIASCDKALALVPQYAEAHFSRGVALHALRQLEAAAASYAKAAAIQPNYAHAHFNLGRAWEELQQWQAAVASYDKAIAARPGHAESYFNRAYALQVLNQLDAALAGYDKAIAIQADYAQAHCNRGVVLQALQQWRAAVASYDQAIAIKPDHAKACTNRGVALQELRQLEAAVASHDAAIALQPDYAQAHSNRGIALHALGQLDAAIASYDRAIALQPDFAQAHSNRGLALHALRLLDAAVACYDQAIAIQPDDGQALFNKSLSLLLGGVFQPGWALYESRWEDEKSKPYKRHFTQPLWLGDAPLAGKTILLHSEQGYGDTIQFCRYAAAVAALGARVVLEVPKELMGLLAGLDGVDGLIARGTPLPAFDYQCPLLSLPLAFQTTLDTIPATQAYLRCDDSKLQAWSARLGEPAKPRVGLMWSGSTAHTNDANRSIALTMLSPYLSGGFEYVSLHKELRDADKDALAQLGFVRHFGEQLQDFGDTAALCALMDVVVCVDTSVAHLSAALGRPTWVLLPFVPDWRWLLERDDSPWYPSVKLYRQNAIGDWDGVLGRVQADLLKR